MHAILANVSIYAPEQYICGMTCGYVCPQCEGQGTLENGEPCDYCTRPISQLETDELLPITPEAS